MTYRFTALAVLILALASVLLGARVAQERADAAPAPIVRLPLVQAPTTPASVLLVKTDSTFVSAAYDESTGRIFVSYIDRRHGNRLIVSELVNDQLVSLSAPATLQPNAAGPSYTPLGNKDADSALLAINGWLWLFHTTRPTVEDGDPGPFELRLERWRP